ncbi:MAG: hypothetical protein LBD90_07325 [Bifidobacteriaceae bacterium]|jgi:hypothetical protein|nr:hypothetical protein [Bifidobacteriaceae bacterium]
MTKAEGHQLALEASKGIIRINARRVVLLVTALSCMLAVIRPFAILDLTGIFLVALAVFNVLLCRRFLRRFAAERPGDFKYGLSSGTTLIWCVFALEIVGPLVWGTFVVFF